MNLLSNVLEQHKQIKWTLEEQYPDYEVVTIDGGSRTRYARTLKTLCNRGPAEFECLQVYQEYKVYMRGNKEWDKTLDVFVVIDMGDKVHVKNVSLGMGEDVRGGCEDGTDLSSPQKAYTARTLNP